MRFLRTLRTDFCRMFLSGKFYSAAGAVAGIALLSVWPEAQSGGYRTSVYYLVNARGGISAFLLAISVLIVVPYALSGREDAQNHYVHCMESRAGLWNYTWSKIITASAGAFLAVFLGYALCFGLLSLKLPVISADEVSALSRQMAQGSLNLYDVLALKGPRILFFAAQFATEGLGYAFMAGFAVMMSVKIENVFVLLSVPIMFYYGSSFLAALFKAPGIFCWYYVMNGGGWLRQIAPSLGILMLLILLYFGSLICLEGIVYYFWMKRRKIYG